ncbi:peptide MFS transporter [Sphingomonas alba]|uniref:MFS transporter n=1 Tax=Sphingomonas alba TaxID=2908208 RepID=A0ABT0RLI9_9SPHN|nr:MFS transporter [Sphingomonas alba]MCL6683517.1 MFS transporter [Sphingomonas alba]
MATVALDSAAPAAVRRHPPGLWTLAATELWDRASFYGMQALLILYMTQYLLLPGPVDQVVGLHTLKSVITAVRGPLSVEGQATQIFALYITVLSLLPLVGGWLGDRFISRRAGVIAGASLMSAGHVFLGYTATFLVGLMLVLAGAGLLRGNVTPQIRALYDAEDTRTAEAFQIFYLTVSGGGFISPLIIGIVNERYGFHPAFAIAAVGMLIGLAWYLARMKTLPPDPPRTMRVDKAAALTSAEKRNVRTLLLFFAVPLAFWVAQAQVWNIYNIWVKDHVDRVIGGFRIPIPWLQSFDSLAPMVMAIAAIFYWRKGVPRTENYGRMAAGCALFGLGMLILAAAPSIAGRESRIPILLPIAFHIVSNAGWVLFVPTCAAFVATYAPESWRGTMLGLNLLTVSVAGFVSGPLSSIYEARGPTFFWAAIAVVPIAGSVILLVATPSLRRLLTPLEVPQST